MKKAAKILLAILPFKKGVFLFIRTCFRPSERIYRHLHFKGKIKLRIDGDHSFHMMHYGFQLENELFWAGLQNGWEKESVSVWLKLSAISTTIFDIGANTGCFALMSASLNPKSEIYAFEPVERVYEKLVYNIQLNNFAIVPVKAALSNYTGTATIYDQPTEHIYSVTVNQNLSHAGQEVIPTEIPTLTLSDFIEANSISRIDLMKIDVETHEPEVLAGFGKYLADFKPALLIEILSDEVGTAVQELLAGLGYDYYNIDEQKGLTKVDDLVKSSSFNFLICQPEISGYLGLNG